MIKVNILYVSCLYESFFIAKNQFVNNSLLIFCSTLISMTGQMISMMKIASMTVHIVTNAELVQNSARS